MSSPLGEAFAHAVATKDHDRLRALLHPDVDFRGMTPSRVWEASDAEAVVEALRTWFDDEDDIRSVEAVESASFADRERVGYRFLVENPAGRHLVEQQAYLSAREGRIGWLRIMCSGYRSVPS